MKNKVLIQRGHLTNYGAEVRQGIELSGASILSVVKNSCSLGTAKYNIKTQKNICCICMLYRIIALIMKQ